MLRIELKGTGEGTQLTMKHTKVPESQADDYAEGWMEHYWQKMISYFETMKAKA
jgi:hypothetical protein